MRACVCVGSQKLFVVEQKKRPKSLHQGEGKFGR
jgi:hypothetical protein